MGIIDSFRPIHKHEITKPFGMCFKQWGVNNNIGPRYQVSDQIKSDYELDRVDCRCNVFSELHIFHSNAFSFQSKKEKEKSCSNYKEHMMYLNESNFA